MLHLIKKIDLTQMRAFVCTSDLQCKLQRNFSTYHVLPNSDLVFYTVTQYLHLPILSCYSQLKRGIWKLRVLGFEDQQSL